MGLFATKRYRLEPGQNSASTREASPLDRGVRPVSIACAFGSAPVFGRAFKTCCGRPDRRGALAYGHGYDYGRLCGKPCASRTDFPCRQTEALETSLVCEGMGLDHRAAIQIRKSIFEVVSAAQFWHHIPASFSCAPFG